jgi:Rhodopirellula transposase DDE domain
VVVKTIAATRTSSGLGVEAALDPGEDPTGVAISRQRLDALPLERHAVHGTWNYTLRPQPASCCTEAARVGAPGSPAQRRQVMLQQLADLRLTGMTSTELERLVATLAPAQAARAHQRHRQQRGGRARRATGTLRSTPLFNDAARLLITLLYQRQVCSMNVLSDLLEVTATCIGDTVKQTREALEDHGHTFLDTDTRPARTQLLKQLSHPALTGISRPTCSNSPNGSHPGNEPRPSASATSGAVARVSPAPAAASSTRRSATANASFWPSSTSADCAPWTSSPTFSRSAGPGSATPSARPARSSNRPGTPPHRHQPATAPPPNSWPP